MFQAGFTLKSTSIYLSGRLLIPLMAVFLMAFQNCAPARFSSVAGVSSTGPGVDGLGTGDNNGNGGDNNPPGGGPNPPPGGGPNPPPGGGPNPPPGGGPNPPPGGGPNPPPGGGPNPPPGGGPNPPPGGGPNPPPGEQVCGKNLIKNGSFEVVDGRVGLVNWRQLKELALHHDWDVFLTLPDGDGGVAWYTEDGTAGIEVQAGTVVAAADGEHYVELDSHPTQYSQKRTNSGMFQQVVIEQEGDYLLRFRYRARNNDHDDNTIIVLLDNQKIAERNNADTASWQKVKVHLKGLSKGSHIITFRAAGKENTYGGFIDEVGLERICKP